MIRNLTVFIFGVTPVLTALAWFLVGPLALLLLLVLPLLGVLTVALRIRANPEATAALLADRQRLGGDGD